MHVNLKFLERDKKYQYEKPFALRYNPLEGVEPSNIEIETIEVDVNDVREMEPKPNFEVNGFEVISLKSRMRYEDWDEVDKIKDLYFAEVKEALCKLFGGTHVQIFEYRIRRCSQSFPVADGQTLQWAQPVRVAHIDFNLDEIRKMIHYHNGEKAEAYTANRFQAVNVWKPLKGPVPDWPLAICDASTVHSSKDLVTADVVYTDHVEENYQVHYNKNQRWYYMSAQMPDEAWVFRCADSCEAKVGPGAPHCSFSLPLKIRSMEFRESIEIRALILRDDE